MNDDPRHRRLVDLFEAARELPVGERRRFLERQGAGDTELVNEVLELLWFMDAVGDDDRWSDGLDSPEALRGMLERLRRFEPREARYSLEQKLAEGGQGIVYRVWDHELERPLAMKVTIGQASGERTGDTPSLDSRTLARFVDEARITGQLDHPGIVPVHALGVDASGRAYFTMRLVRGSTLAAVFDWVRRGERGWTQARALDVLVRVCEAVGYAHAKRIIHRDLKPSNVMVGSHGEVYVMDWGLGRSLDHTDRPPVDPEESTVGGPTRSGTSQATADGHAVGTPEYMAPEQARGDLDAVDRRADVYALGAILYELLAGAAPYRGPGGRDARRIAAAVVDGPPEPLAVAAPEGAPELVAICERAMARDPANRFPDVGALAADLRAFREHRVVPSYRTGPLIELRKWVRRNPAAAAAVAAVVLALSLGGFFASEFARRRALQAQVILETRAGTLAAQAERLWPLEPATLPAMDRWLATARAAVRELPRARAELARLDARADVAVTPPPPDPRAAHRAGQIACQARLRDALRGLLDSTRAALAAGQSLGRLGRNLAHEVTVLAVEVEATDAELAVLERELAPTVDGRVDSTTGDLERYRQLALVERLEELAGDDGLIAAIERRRAVAASLPERSFEGPGAAAWSEARAAIASSPLYGGLELEPQLGLVPLGPDGSSGLWEFWHVTSGARPRPAPGGGWDVEPSTGVVLVLVPGGRYRFGAQYVDPEAPHYVDPDLPFIPAPFPEEGPVQAVELAPYFLSKYELTQAQWRRLAGRNPSTHMAGAEYLRTRDEAFPRIDATHPVEQISFEDALVVLHRVGLTVPTEAQWEVAARAGEEGPYWGGDDHRAILGRVNFADLSAEARRLVRLDRSPDVDDGHDVHAPVDRFGPNAFGFCSIVGNVWEWCRDWTNPSKYEPDPELRPPGSALTGELGASISRSKAARGGSYLSNPGDLRLSRRLMRAPLARHDDIGVRPSRPLR